MKLKISQLLFSDFIGRLDEHWLAQFHQLARLDREQAIAEVCLSYERLYGEFPAGELAKLITAYVYEHCYQPALSA